MFHTKFDHRADSRYKKNAKQRLPSRSHLGIITAPVVHSGASILSDGVRGGDMPNERPPGVPPRGPVDTNALPLTMLSVSEATGSSNSIQNKSREGHQAGLAIYE